MSSTQITRSKKQQGSPSPFNSAPEEAAVSHYRQSTASSGTGSVAQYDYIPTPPEDNSGGGKPTSTCSSRSRTPKIHSHAQSSFRSRVGGASAASSLGHATPTPEASASIEVIKIPTPLPPIQGAVAAAPLFSPSSRAAVETESNGLESLTTPISNGATATRCASHSTRQLPPEPSPSSPPDQMPTTPPPPLAPTTSRSPTVRPAKPQNNFKREVFSLSPNTSDEEARNGATPPPASSPTMIPTSRVRATVAPPAPEPVPPAQEGPVYPPPMNDLELKGACSISPQICCPLYNQGNSCYFNSCIQLFANCPAFVYGLRNSPLSRSRRVVGSMKGRSSNTSRVSRKANTTPSQHLYESVARLLFRMEFQSPAQGSALSTEEALNSLGEVNPTFEGRSQQDCAEMMCAVLGSVEEEGRLTADLNAMLQSFKEDRRKMVASPISMEDSRMLLMDDDLDNEEGEMRFSEHSSTLLEAEPTSIKKKKSGGTMKPVTSTSQELWNMMSTAPRVCGSTHWHHLLMLMQRINEENSRLEERAAERKKNAKKNSTASTRYTLSETHCHKCQASSRCLHDFQMLLLDIPSTEERLQSGSWKMYKDNRVSMSNSNSGIFAATTSELPNSHCQSPRPQSTPAAQLRAYEARAAESVPEGPTHERVMSCSGPDVQAASRPRTPSRSAGLHSRSTSLSGATTPPVPAFSATSSSAVHSSGGSAGRGKKSAWGGSMINFFSSVKDKIFRKHIDDPRSLKECMYHHFLPYQFKGQNLYRCDACGGQCEATKTEYLAHLPETLLVQMKRFESGALFQSKKTEPVIFPVSWQPLASNQPFSALQQAEVLDLIDFIYPPLRPTYCSSKDEEAEMRSHAHHVAEKGGGAEGNHRRTQSMSNYSYGSQAGGTGALQQPVSTYSLVGVVNHHGSLGGGHYTAYARKTAPDGTNLWLLLNDDEVVTVEEREVADSEEYILMYRQQPIVRRPQSIESRLQELARYLLQTVGKRPCLENGRPVVPPVPNTAKDRPKPVYISRAWLHNAAFLGDPGPILNRICYCSVKDLNKPVPLPSGVLPPGSPPSATVLSTPGTPHVHLVPLEWFYVSVSEEDYDAFYRQYGGNAYITPTELELLLAEQMAYKKFLGIP